MEESIFQFLKKEFPEIYNNVIKVEKHIINEDNDSALVFARKSLELIINQILDIESIYRHPTEKLSSKLNKIKKEKDIFPESILKKCFSIKSLGDKASHDGSVEFSEKDANKIHKLLYDISIKFYNRYNDENITLSYAYKRINGVDEIEHSEDIDSSEELSKLKGSYLLYMLNKLQTSSKEAVEGFEGLSKFKDYIHVERDIQKELFNKLEEVSKKEGSNLVLLAGSVGDGKSHLLAYFNEHHNDLIKNFEIHNDATESNDPNETCIDTLSHVLEPFNDKNINISNNKLILSINLGVLNNFLDSKYSGQFSELRKILDYLNIFDETVMFKLGL